MADGFFNYQDLDVWKRIRILVKIIYKMTDNFPKSQQFSLCQQMQRAAVSIPSNIAEGQAKKSTRDYIRHLNIALGSLAELDTQILLSFDLGYIDEKLVASAREECVVIARMLNKLISNLKNNLLKSAYNNSNNSLNPTSQTPTPKAGAL